MGNSYLENAYSDTTIEEAVERAVACPRCKAAVGDYCTSGGVNRLPHADRLRKGYGSFQEMVAKLSLEGLSLSDIARRLGLVAQRFTAYHAKWMRDNAEPLDLEDV
jgi:hypothetical protein